MIETVKHLIGSGGPSGFGSRSTAEHVTANCDLRSLTAIITGATSGIGAETARVLAKRGARLVIPARSLKTAEETKSRILSEFPDAEIIVMHLDLSSLASVRRFVADFESLHLPLNILINNAGKYAQKHAISEDGVEMTFATNYLGHFLLTKLLLKNMIETAEQTGVQGRIVNVTSVIHSWFSGDMLQYVADISRNNRNYDATRAYALSKLANVLHTIELSRILHKMDANVTANCVHPGIVRTRLTRDRDGLITDLVFFLTSKLLKSVSQAAATTCYVATSPRLRNVCGKYFSDCNEARTSKSGSCNLKAQRLWTASELLVAPASTPNVYQTFNYFLANDASMYQREMANAQNAFTIESLRTLAKQSFRCLVVPVRLRRAIKKYLREEDDPHIRKKVRQLSESFQEIKDSNLLLPETTAKRLADSMNSVEAKRWKIQTVYGDSGLQYRDGETAAYVASRMPAAYSVCYRVLTEIRRRLPGFKPTRVLDFGAGTGSGFWAVQEVWPKCAQKVNIVEPSQSMQRAGRDLLQGLKDLPLIHGYTSLLSLSQELNKKCRILNDKSERKHELVIASYVLGEIPSLKDRITMVRQLWDLTDDLLVLVEPGTPHGANIISQMRSYILWMENRKLRKKEKAEAGKEVLDLKSGAHIVAPCPHDGKCPLENTAKYCHFVQRLQRTSSQRSYKRTKGVPLRGFEDEKFCFVVFRRGQRPREPWPLDNIKLETLKEMRANRKPEDLEIDYEEFIKTQVVEVPYIDPRAQDSDITDEDEDELEEIEEGEGTDEEDEVEVEEEEGSGRASVGGGWGRIIFPPFRKGKQVTLDMCVPTNEEGSEGAFERRVITKSKNPHLHLQAKKSFWGDLWPLTTQQQEITKENKKVDAEWCRPDEDQKWGAWP
ncbi:BnaA09g12120D [Brassica napus]|uniref:(rape) hypothetical protein n=1 Tax=Brassica napus TaxID=3708 RepID=A0A078IF63_BRANA|nr:unnamed protein product [Brassica napus]CDY47833.1 BnaA09g12120D [Brassica napus]